MISAPTFKLIGNSVILGALEILAESFTLAEKSGIKPTQVHNLLKDLMPAPTYVLYLASKHACLANLVYALYRLDAYGNKMVHDLFDGSHGFAIDGGIKDSTHIRKLSAEFNSPMPALVCTTSSDSTHEVFTLSLTSNCVVFR